MSSCYSPLKTKPEDNMAPAEPETTQPEDSSTTLPEQNLSPAAAQGCMLVIKGTGTCVACIEVVASLEAMQH